MQLIVASVTGKMERNNMPSSDPTTIPKVLQLIKVLSPSSILDIGAGNGRNGLLFREILDHNYGRLSPPYQVVIDAIEVESRYITPVHEWIYDNIYTENWLEFEPKMRYDLVFMGDVLEHFKEWQRALMKARRIANTTIVVAPNWKGSGIQGEWGGNKYESHEVELSPAMLGGRCLYANSKCFICSFDSGLLENRNVLL